MLLNIQTPRYSVVTDILDTGAEHYVVTTFYNWPLVWTELCLTYFHVNAAFWMVMNSTVSVVHLHMFCLILIVFLCTSDTVFVLINRCSCFHWYCLATNTVVLLDVKSFFLLHVCLIFFFSDPFIIYKMTKDLHFSFSVWLKVVKWDGNKNQESLKLESCETFYIH